jgi:hypothetical protein
MMEYHGRIQDILDMDITKYHILLDKQLSAKIKFRCASDGSGKWA